MRFSSALMRSSDWPISSFLVATPPANTEVYLNGCTVVETE
jgi:hypothetical protein